MARHVEQGQCLVLDHQIGLRGRAVRGALLRRLRFVAPLPPTALALVGQRIGGTVLLRRRLEAGEEAFETSLRPVDNAICESANGRIRVDYLNTTVFTAVQHAAEEAAEFR
ncbi:MAG: hypothetical protein H6700_12205, partial [Myxococcales bacterium]|nr:hypothetical protein [Myxococcales bacterium]